MGFLEDYIYKPQQTQVIKNSISGVFDILKSNIDEVDRNVNLSKLLTYKRIQFQRIDITNVAYSLTSLLNNSQVISFIGGNKNTSMQTRLETWNSMTALEQANILDMAGYYLEMTDNVLSSLTDDLKRKKFDIIDFELCDLQNNLLIRNVDYVFYDNKLILLKEFLDHNNYKKKYLIMKNIVVDAGITESVLGGFMNMPSNKELTKVEYNEILKGFTAAASKGPIIGEYTEALNRYKSLDGIRVYDKVNADPTRRHFWGDGTNIGDFTKFDFIVSMPVQLVRKPEKLDYIINFFNQTKPAYANFVFSPELLTTDVLPLKSKATLFRTSGKMSGLKDKIKNKSIGEYLSSHKFEESFMLHKRVNEQAVKTPIQRVEDSFILFGKETKTYYDFILNIIDIIPQQTKVIGKLSVPMFDRAQIGKGLGGDSFYLDEDYFDTQVLSDPLWSRIYTDFTEYIGYNNSSIVRESVQQIKDTIRRYEVAQRDASLGLHDTVKVFNPLNDYVYCADEDDYLDSPTLNDINNLCMMPNNLIDRIPDMNEGLSILNAKNLYDRMNNVDIANKILSTSCSDSVQFVNRANVLVCDSIFDCDYTDETEMILDSAPEGYDEYVQAGLVGREAICLELIPKNITGGL